MGRRQSLWPPRRLLQLGGERGRRRPRQSAQLRRGAAPQVSGLRAAPLPDVHPRRGGVRPLPASEARGVAGAGWSGVAEPAIVKRNLLRAQVVPGPHCDTHREVAIAIDLKAVVTVVDASSFMQTNSQTSVYVAGGGSSAGASRVCSTGQDHVDIGDMSRGWKAIEASRQGNSRNYTCANSDVEVTQIPIALDGITVIVKRGGAAAECIERLGGLSIAQLRWIYSDWTDEDLAYSSEADLDMASVTSNNDGDTGIEPSFKKLLT